MLLFGTLLLQSCKEKPFDATPDPAQRMQQLLDELSQNSAEFAAPEPPELPLDLGTHTRTRMESWSVKGILWLDDKPRQQVSDAQVGIIVQMDRVAITPASNNLPADSAWRYNGIIRSSVFFDTPSERSDPEAATGSDQSVAAQLAALSSAKRRQSVQRMAVDLAGVSDNEMWAGSDRLMILQANGNDNPCTRTYRWEVALSATDQTTLDVEMTSCPGIQAFGEFNGWQQTSADLTGVLVTRTGTNAQIVTPVSGVSWMSQTWGNIPVQGGAVAIDSLQIKLDDARWLNVTRSKRRSGRGPETVTASIHREGSEPRDIALTWEDSHETVMADSGLTYPASIDLLSVDHDLEVSVTVMNQLSESSDVGDARLDVPVMVTGTHPGAGFLFFTSLVQ